MNLVSRYFEIIEHRITVFKYLKYVTNIVIFYPKITPQKLNFYYILFKNSVYENSVQIGTLGTRSANRK